MSETNATWFLIKYVADLRRQEPRNIGLVLETPDGWITKFVGEAEDGEIKGNRLNGKLDVELYRTWVQYFRRKAVTQQWEDVERMQHRRRSNYFSEKGGVIYDTEGKTWASLLESMYGELVQSKSERISRATREYLLIQARRALALANVPVEEKVEVQAKYGERTTTVPFEFRHLNGKTRLMDAVNLSARNADSRARELRARIEGVRHANIARDFFTFYLPGNHTPTEIDDILLPLEAQSEAIDVTNPDDAAVRVAELVNR